MPSKVPFFDLFIDDLELETAADYLFGLQKSIHIISLNLEQFVLSQDDEKHNALVKEAEIIIADGAIISLFSGIKKLAGIDLAAQLISKSKRLALVGASEEVNANLAKKYSSKIVFAQDGFFDLSQKTQVQQAIIDAKPDLILVAMGIPKQEIFIGEIKSKLDNCILMGVGGSFDVWSGKLKRAPQWMISLGLEWFFRLIQEPSRIKRFLYKVRRFLLLLTVGGHRRGDKWQK